MNDTLTARRRSPLALVVTDIVDLIAAQPPQALLSVASIAIVAGEASFMVPFPANVALAVGAEWAYLRGIASSPKGAKGWTQALNWGALALVVLYGLLWGVRKFGADPVLTFTPWGLTLLHILPVAFVSFAAAMVHRSAVEAEAAERAAHDAEAAERSRRLQAEDDERQRRRQAAQDEAEARRLAWELEEQAQDRELQRKIEAARVKAELSSRVKSEAVKDVDSVAAAASESAAPRLPKDVRLDTLLTLIGQAGGVDTLDITATAQRFGVSRQTVYNDLETLRNTGRLTKEGN